MARRILLSQDEINKISSFYTTDGYSAATISNITGYSTGFIQRTLRDNKIKSRSLSDATNRIKGACNIFANLDTEYSAYYLGLFFSDGNIKKDSNCCELKLIERDRHILTRLSELIFGVDRTIFINYQKYSYGKNASNLYTLKISKTDIKQSLISYGCVPAKSLILQFPSLPNEISKKHFIRGYFDGDGSIYRDGSSFNVGIVSTNDFCLELKRIIENSCHIRCQIVNGSGPNNKITKKLLVRGNRQVYQFMSWLYEGAEYYLYRKHDKFLELRQRLQEIDARHPNRYR